jgi:glycosyltransferase involved in cell wall biosynthesis
MSCAAAAGDSMTSAREKNAIRHDCVGIREEAVRGGVILSRPAHSNGRRVLFINSYGGANLWRKIQQGHQPTHHLWGCLELLSHGYTVLVAEPLKHFEWRGRIFPHDLKYHRHIVDWVRREDIVFCAHTLLYWLPLLQLLGYRRRTLVSLAYAREKLDFARAHRAVIALTPAAADEARRMAPRAKIAMLGWGADLAFFPALPYSPQFFLSNGRTLRDFETLARGVALSGYPTSILSAPKSTEIPWSRNVDRVPSGSSGEAVPFDELIHRYYANCTASLIALKPDPREKTAVGLTSAIEAMAMARPVIVTRTGAMPCILDLEQRHCGLAVPPQNPEALAEAMRFMVENPSKAAEMGAAGRRHCESYFNIERYAADLHALFESL